MERGGVNSGGGRIRSVARWLIQSVGFSEAQSRANPNLIPGLAFTQRTSAEHHPAKTEEERSRAERKCLLNPPWIDGSIGGVNGLLIKLITGPGALKWALCKL